MRGVGLLGLLVLGASGALAVDQIVPEAKEVSDECIVAFNLGRTGHLNTRLPLLVKGNPLLFGALDAVKNAITTFKSCEELEKLDRRLYNAPLWWFEGDDPKCKKLVQEDITDFLVQSPSYPPPIGDVDPWRSALGDRIAHMLWENCKQAECAMTQRCPRNFVLCYFHPAAAGGDVIFSPEFYNALVERQKEGLDISNMTQDDLNTPLRSGSSGRNASSGGNASSGAAIPGCASGVWVLGIAVGASLAQIR